MASPGSREKPSRFDTTTNAVRRGRAFRGPVPGPQTAVDLSPRVKRLEEALARARQEGDNLRMRLTARLDGQHTEPDTATQLPMAAKGELELELAKARGGP
jgi:hypothetical protein